MFNRKFSSNIRRRKRMITTMVILLVVCLGIGYSLFSTNLGINGTLNVSKYDQTLYGVLEKAAKVGTYAKEYTGEHQDSMAGVGTEKIYHWYAPSSTAGNTLATEILDKNNVIFADHCWQMIRTTDTGGVKMIYNGEPENNQCLNTRGNHVGYASITTQSMSTTYYYGTSYTYDSTNNIFSLDGTITTGTIQTGQYTCRQTSSTGTCATLYLVDTLSSGTTYYVLSLKGNSHYSQFGTLQFNQDYNSPAYVGYMYSTVYPVISAKNSFEITYPSGWDINSNFYYSDTIDYGNQNVGKYTLINPNKISTLSNYNDLVGKYVLASGGTNNISAYYVTAVEGNKLYHRNLLGGDLNISLTVGDSYTESGGTYTLTNPTEVTYIDWYNGDYSNNKTKYVCDGANSTCNNLKHIGNSTSENYYDYWGIEQKYKYSESVSYSGGAYTLTGDIKELWDIPNSTTQETIGTHHYTCLNSGINCEQVYYAVYYINSRFDCLKLNHVTDISASILNMLSIDDVNSVNSTMKTGIDAWYKNNMVDYESQIEDTIYCNNRIISSLGSWNPSGGKLASGDTYLKFSNYYNSNKDLICTNVTDKFSMNNTKAQLAYPVGLLTYQEVVLLNNKNITKTGQSYWTFSPDVYGGQLASVNDVHPEGDDGSSRVNSTIGVRPAVSLAPGTEYTSGSGSMSDPYVVQ